MNRKEALQNVKRMIGFSDTLDESIFILFPELKESEGDSEDEEIRKVLINIVKGACHKYGIKYIGDKISEEKLLSYLEKQKEQKSLNISAASEWLRKHVCTYMNSEYNEFHKCVEYDGSIDKERLVNDFEEAMQKEQKPDFIVPKRIRPKFAVGDTVCRPMWSDHTIQEIYIDCDDPVYFCINEEGIESHISFSEQDEWERKEQKSGNNSTREKIISRATSEKQVVLISESDGEAEIGWDTRSLEDAKRLLEYGLAFINNSVNSAEKQKDNKFAPRVLPCSAAWFEDGEEKQKEQKLNHDKEKLIKSCIGLILTDATDKRFKDYGLTLKDCLTWLDMQEGQKPVEWSERDEKNRKFAIDWLNVYKTNYASQESTKEEIDEIVAWLKSLHPQPKQEWSEEDKFKLEDAITGIDVGIGFYETEGKHPNLLKAIIEAKDWLKSLPKRFNLQPKQEWSEEDKAIIGCIVCCLDGQFVTEAARKQCLEWFNKHHRDFLNQQKQEWSEEDKALFELLHQCVCRCINDDRMIYSERERISKTMIPFIEKLQTLCPQPKNEWSKEDEANLNEALSYIKDDALKEFIKSLCSQAKQEQKEPSDKGEISDGYHTFNELYYYRLLYNAAFFNLLPKEWVHKSKRHHDGEECFGGGWFIVTANLPTGQISNHYEIKDWDLFHIPEKETADKWDGHTPQEAAKRLHKFLLEMPDLMPAEYLPKGKSMTL